MTGHFLRLKEMLEISVENDGDRNAEIKAIVDSLQNSFPIAGDDLDSIRKRLNIELMFQAFENLGGKKFLRKMTPGLVSADQEEKNS